MRPPSHRPATLLSALALAALLVSPAPPAAAQAITIPEYRELLLSKESSLARLDRELALANARLDRLVTEKEAAGSPRRQRSRELSAEIVKVSTRIGDLERQRRAAEADLRALRAALQERYTADIDGNLERLADLEQDDPDYGALLIETGRYVNARDSLRLQIRIQESLQNFREFPIVETDGPAEIREKAGFYRDYVRDIANRIAAIDRDIEQLREREQVRRRMRELQADLVFEGEDVPTRPGDGSDAGGVGDILEEPTPEQDPEGLDLFPRSVARLVAELEEEKRQLELLRTRFEARIRDYDQRARTVYSRQTSPNREESR